MRMLKSKRGRIKVLYVIFLLLISFSALTFGIYQLYKETKERDTKIVEISDLYVNENLGISKTV